MLFPSFLSKFGKNDKGGLLPKFDRNVDGGGGGGGREGRGGGEDYYLSLKKTLTVVVVVDKEQEEVAYYCLCLPLLLIPLNFPNLSKISFNSMSC